MKIFLKKYLKRKKVQWNLSIFNSDIATATASVNKNVFSDRLQPRESRGCFPVNMVFDLNSIHTSRGLSGYSVVIALLAEPLDRFVIQRK